MAINIYKEKSVEDLVSLIEYFEELLHDVKTPFSIIYALLQLIENCENNDISFKTYVTLMKKNCDIINKLLLSSTKSTQILSNQYIAQYKNYNITEVVKDISLSMITIGSRKKIDIVFNSDEKPIISATDKDLLERIILNLVSNAIKYSPENTIVYVSVFEIDSYFYGIEIKDQGFGISGELKNKLYTRYEKDNEIYNPYSTGIGLSIVKNIVDIFKGSIEIKVNDNNIGTSVNLKMPMFVCVETFEDDSNINLLDCQHI